MNILYLTNHLRGTDGWSRYSLTLIKEMKRRGHKVLVAVEKGVKTESGFDEADFLSDYTDYILNPLCCYRTAKKIQSLVDQFQPDVVHAIVEPYANILPFLRLTQKTKTILTIHGTFSYTPNLFKNKIKKYIARTLFFRALNSVDSIISISTFTRDYFYKNLVGRKTPYLKVVSNGVEISSYQSNISLDKKSEISKILFVGAIKLRKGIRELIVALKYYQDNFSKDFTCDLVGFFDERDAYYQQMSGLVKNLSLGEKIFFRGRLSEDDLEKFYAEADLFILLPVMDRYRFEGFGLVYLEAGARGVPVIGAKNSGATDAIADGKSGFLVDSNNPEEVAWAIEAVLYRKKIRAEDCRAWAEAHSMETIAEEVLAVYQR